MLYALTLETAGGQDEICQALLDCAEAMHKAVVNKNHQKRRRLNDEIRECTNALQVLSAAGGGHAPTVWIPEYLASLLEGYIAPSFEEIVERSAYAGYLACLKAPISHSPTETYTLLLHQLALKVAQAIRLGRGVLPRSGLLRPAKEGKS